MVYFELNTKMWRINKKELLRCILEIFFILSFVYITYKTNIYVLYGVLTLLPVSFFVKNKNIFPLFVMCLLMFLSFFYFGMHGFLGAVRVVKTLVICVIFVIIDSCSFSSDNRLRYVHCFMTLSAYIVCIDFILYWLGLPTIMNFVCTGIMPRPSGFMEDSNFYSYVTVCYIMYLRSACNTSAKLFIISVLLSGSFSAIILLLILLLFLKKTSIKYLIKKSRGWRLWRFWIIGTVLFVHTAYYAVVKYQQEIVDYVETLEMNSLFKMKTFSLFLRFDAQSNALNQIASENKQLFGLGPGEAKTLNDRNINLHNTFYQMYVEMGVLFLIIVLFLLLYVMWRIENVFFLLIFGLVSLFGNMLEIFYFPILPFAFLLYKVNQNVLLSSKISNSFSRNVY